MIVTGPYPVCALDGPGAVHIDRIVREVIASRDNTDTAAIRLLVAAIAADVLDGAA